MDHIFREKVYESSENNGGGWNTRERTNTALGFGIAGTVLGAAALAKGGLGGILGGLTGGGTVPVPVSAPAPVSISYTGCCAPSAFSAYAKECDDYVELLNTVYGLKIGTLQAAQAARDVDVNEKFQLYKSQIDADFGLYVNTRDNIDKVNGRINDELFSLYKYTRDKDDETNAKISALEAKVAVNSAVRPYQDKLIQCEIEKTATWLKNYIDTKTCRMIEGVVTLPLTPEVTGVLSQNCCNRLFGAIAAGGGGAAAAGGAA